MTYAQRIERVRERMDACGVDAVLLSMGADLPYLTGYEAMPLERLTMLVLPRRGDARLVVARLEAPRVEPRPEFEVVAWDEPGDPIALVASMVGNPGRVAIGDQTWAGFVLDLQRALPKTSFGRASEVVGPVRAAKDPDEIAALRAAGSAVDRVAAVMRARPFAGRTEIDVHRELVARMLELGHQKANFAIVGAAEHAASPHHEPGARVIADGEVVLCDFGGTMNGYCSDITRMFHVGTPTAEVTARRSLHRVRERGTTRRGQRLQHRARHLPARPIRAATRRHRGRDRRGPRPPQPRRARHRGRRMTRADAAGPRYA